MSELLFERARECLAGRIAPIADEDRFLAHGGEGSALRLAAHCSAGAAWCRGNRARRWGDWIQGGAWPATLPVRQAGSRVRRRLGSPPGKTVFRIARDGGWNPTPRGWLESQPMRSTAQAGKPVFRIVRDGGWNPIPRGWLESQPMRSTAQAGKPVFRVASRRRMESIPRGWLESQP